MISSSDTSELFMINYYSYQLLFNILQSFLNEIFLYKPKHLISYSALLYLDYLGIGKPCDIFALRKIDDASRFDDDSNR